MTPLVGSVFVVVCACVINYIIVNNIRIVHELTRTYFPKVMETVHLVRGVMK